MTIDEQQVAPGGATCDLATQQAVDLQTLVAHDIHQPLGALGNSQRNRVALPHPERREVVEGIALAQRAGGHQGVPRCDRGNGRLGGRCPYQRLHHGLCLCARPAGRKGQRGRQRQRCQPQLWCGAAAHVGHEAGRGGGSRTVHGGSR